MTVFVNLSCDFYEDTRVVTVGPWAELLYVRGLLFTKRMQQGDWFSTGQLRVIAFGIPRRDHLASQLIDVGLWGSVSDGFIIRDWQRFTRERLPSLPPSVRNAVIERDGLVCGLCGDPVADPSDIDIDHIIPRARGGGDELTNLQVSHSRCNRSKGARI